MFDCPAPCRPSQCCCSIIPQLKADHETLHRQVSLAKAQVILSAKDVSPKILALYSAYRDSPLHMDIINLQPTHPFLCTMYECMVRLVSKVQVITVVYILYCFVVLVIYLYWKLMPNS